MTQLPGVSFQPGAHITVVIVTDPVSTLRPNETQTSQKTLTGWTGASERGERNGWWGGWVEGWMDVVEGRMAGWQL